MCSQLILLTVFVKFKLDKYDKRQNSLPQEINLPMKMRSVNVFKELDGSTPPSVFIGTRINLGFTQDQ